MCQRSSWKHMVGTSRGSRTCARGATRRSGVTTARQRSRSRTRWSGRFRGRTMREEFTAEELAEAERLQRQAWSEGDEERRLREQEELRHLQWPDDLLEELAQAAREARRTNAQRGFID